MPCSLAQAGFGELVYGFVSQRTCPGFLISVEVELRPYLLCQPQVSVVPE